MKLLALIKNDFKLLLRDRGELITLFLMPLAFILPVCFALGGGNGYGVGRDNSRINLPVANLDGGVEAKALIDTLSESLYINQVYSLDRAEQLGLSGDPACLQVGAACDEQIMRTSVAQGLMTAAIIIPSGFSAAIEQGQPAQVTFLYDPAGDATRRQQLEGVVNGAVTRMSLEKQLSNSMDGLLGIASFASEDVQKQIEVQAAEGEGQGSSQTPALRLQTVQPTSYSLPKLPDTYQQTVPGYTVMFVFFIIAYISGAVHEEKRQGTYRRLMSLPVNRSLLLAGKLLTAILVAVVQVGLMFAVGALLFGLSLGHNLLALLLVTLALSLAASAIGLAASTVRIGNILVAPLILSALLGGCMFPIDLMPKFMRTFSYLVPHSWALTGFQNVMVRGQGVAQVLPQVGVLLGFAMLFFLVAVRGFSFEE